MAFVLFVLAMMGGLVLACLAAVVSFAGGALLTRGVERGRGGFLAMTVLFPFLCVAWMGVAYVGHGAVKVLVFDRNVVGADEMDFPLPNGYALSFAAGSREVAALYRPQGWPRWRSGKKDGIPDVRLLQMANGYLLGGRGRQLVETPEIGDRTVESYFLLDTASGQRREFSTLPELEEAAGKLGLRPQMRPVVAFSREFGGTWFDGALPFLMLLPVGFASFGMFRWLGRLRARRA